MITVFATDGFRFFGELIDVYVYHQETMVTKGVASVRSPVQNLRHFDPSITHELFVEATITAFREYFSISEEVRNVFL